MLYNKDLISNKKTDFRVVDKDDNKFTLRHVGNFVCVFLASANEIMTIEAMRNEQKQSSACSSMDDDYYYSVHSFVGRNYFIGE